MDLERRNAGFPNRGSLPAVRGGGHFLAAEHALAYRLGRSLTLAAGGALAGALSIAAAAALVLLLPYLFNGSLLPIIQALVLLAGLFATVISFSGVFVSFAEIGHTASLGIAPGDVLRFEDVNGEIEIGLEDVREVRAEQSLCGEIFGYGTIEIFTYDSSEPAIVIPGIRNPEAFKEKLELIRLRSEATLH